MFTIIVVAAMSLVMWVLGAFITSQGIPDVALGKKSIIPIIFSFPILPWLKFMDKEWDVILIAVFFYTLSILGIISIFYI